MKKHVDAKRLISGVTKVASLPMMYTRITEAVSDPKSSTKHLAEIISEDTALTAKLLRLANSALYNFPSKVNTVNHAVTVIGTRQLCELVLACSVVSLFKDIDAKYVNMESFWRHSVACGVCGRILASHRRDPNVEAAFVAGLLHDIGRLIMLKEIPEIMNEVFQESEKEGELLYVSEYSLMGINHATLGGMLLEQWRLPLRLIESVKYHHNPEVARNYSIEAAINHVSDAMAHGLLYGGSGERFVPPVKNSVWLKIGISDSALRMAIEEVEKQYQAAMEFVAGIG